MLLCTDTDLLRWEPTLFRDAAFASQTLLTGSGDLNGSTFTISTGSFLDARVSAGMVLTLSGALNASYPIVRIDSATQLTVSVLLEGENIIPAGVGTGVNFAIRTFSPQARIVSDLILQSSGVDPAGAQITNLDALIRPATLGTLQLVYNALAAGADSAAYAIRAELYERLYRRALRQVRIRLDTNGDGDDDRVVYPGLVALYRD